MSIGIDGGAAKLGSTETLVQLHRILEENPEIESAVRRLPLHDQLKLTMELLNSLSSGAESQSDMVFPENVIPIWRSSRSRAGPTPPAQLN